MTQNSMFDLTGRVAIVTGSTKGLGRAMAEGLAEAGATVVVSSRKQELCDQVAAEVAAGTGRDVRGMACHVGDWDAIPAFVERVHDTFGRIDILVNNAGISPGFTTYLDMTLEFWRKVFSVNVEGPLRMSQQVVPIMRDNGGGAIVNVSSISALRPRGLTTYTVSKGAVIALTQAMAVDHGKDGIRVNCVAPGPVYTPMVYGRGMSDGARDNRRRASVLAIEGTGWDVGHAVRFLLSEQARYITGHTLVVDGGTTLRAPERESQGN